MARHPKMKRERVWSDRTILKTIPNPSKLGYEIQHESPEVTFLGVQNQPDFATVRITFYPGKSVIELKSLKLYFQQFRDKVISYERLANVIHDDLMAVYKPERVRLVMFTKPRGGISSWVKIDSDWKARGGKERFKDWVGRQEGW